MCCRYYHTSVPAESSHPLQSGINGVSLFLSRDHRPVDVAVARHGGAPTIAGWCLVNMLHAAVEPSADAHLLVEHAATSLFHPGIAELEPGKSLGASSSPLIRIPIEAVLPRNRVPSPLPCYVSVHRLIVPEVQPPHLPAAADNSQQRLQPLVSGPARASHFRGETGVVPLTM